MFERDAIARAVDLQRRSYQLLRWMTDAIDRGFISYGDAHELKPTMTWYQATRHSVLSRHLSRGASLDEVSAAVGHSSPVVTKRFYDHYVRRTFSPKLRAGLGLGAKQEGRVVQMRKSR